jgi:predicted ribosome quality control (RQC) complex YloA/Tae2 family protein
MRPAEFDGWRPELLERVRLGGEGRLPEALCRGVRGFKPDSVRFLVQRPKPHLKEDPRVVLARRLGRWIHRVEHQKETIHVLSFPPDLHRGCQICPFPMRDPDSLALQGDALQVSQFDDYGAALNYMGRGCMARFQMNELVTVLRRNLEHRLQHDRRLLEKLEKDWARAAGAEDMRHQADSLAANLGEVQRGMDSIELDDVHGGERRLDIPLDPRRSPQDNLDRMYKKAAKGERGLRTIEMRLEEVRRRVVEDEELLGERLPALANARCREESEISALREELLRLGAEASLLNLRRTQVGGRPEVAPRPYRRYLLPGGWEALVGRNNRENDQLTHREAAGKDLLFHAAGVSGSHVILKTGGHRSGPPKSVIESAAAIAAFHSKARNSSLVPVIYTEKRYVRKPRKGAPGLALCTREKTLFVEPALPETQAPEH